MPDATGLELLARELREADGTGAGAAAPSPVVETVFFRGHGTLVAEPARIRWVLARLRERGYTFMASLHGVDYYPEEPRLGVLYELLDMRRVDRVTVKVRVSTAAPELDTVCIDSAEGAGWPTAHNQEREVYDMFGVIFREHPDLRRVMMPEDYEGHPQRRDFPLGGEPVLFTHNDATSPGWTR